MWKVERSKNCDSGMSAGWVVTNGDLEICGDASQDGAELIAKLLNLREEWSSLRDATKSNIGAAKPIEVSQTKKLNLLIGKTITHAWPLNDESNDPDNGHFDSGFKLSFDDGSLALISERSQCGGIRLIVDSKKEGAS